MSEQRPQYDEAIEEDENTGTSIRTRLFIAGGLIAVALTAIPVMDSLTGKKAAPQNDTPEPASGRIVASAPMISAPADTASEPAREASTPAAVTPPGSPATPALAQTPGMQITPAVQLPPAQTPQTTPAPAQHAATPPARTPVQTAPVTHGVGVIKPLPATPHAAAPAPAPARQSGNGNAAVIVPRETAPLREAAQASPSPAPVQPAPQARPLGSSLGYNVQLGLFSNMGNAQKMVDELRSRGIEVRTETRIHVGPFRSRAEAEETMAKLKSMGYAPLLAPAGN